MLPLTKTTENIPATKRKEYLFIEILILYQIYTNDAILALNDDNTTAAQDNLMQIQNAIINAIGKQVVIVPAPTVSSPSDDDEDSD